ncbi:MAG: DUF3822 family protein [Saprospiraceae bacterium]|nr:DUF3822 family protein [Saprospiraceae bacterium]
MYQRDFDFLHHNEANLLSVHLTADSFFYGIFDSQNKLLCHKSFNNILFSDDITLWQIINNEKLQVTYNNVSVQVASGNCHLLPEPDHEFINQFPGLELKNIKIEKCVGREVYAYFGITSHQEFLLDRLFNSGDYTLHHFSNQLASYYLAQTGNIIHAHIDQDVLTLYLQINGLFMFYNSFKTVGINDILYFILAVYKEKGLDPTLDELTLSGWVEKNSTLYNLLFAYIANIRLTNDFLMTLSSECSDEYKPHFYFDHFINAICA